jgi:hypothetical protein
VLGGEVADAAAEREAGHTGGPDHSSGRDETDLVRRRVEVEPGRAPLGAGDLRVGVHQDPAHPREVDHQCAVGDAVSRGVVPASAHGYPQLVSTREIEGGADVAGIEAASDDCRPSVDERVEASAGGLILLVSGAEDVAGQRPP